MLVSRIQTTKKGESTPAIIGAVISSILVFSSLSHLIATLLYSNNIKLFAFCDCLTFLHTFGSL